MLKVWLLKIHIGKTQEKLLCLWKYLAPRAGLYPIGCLSRLEPGF